jgi:hypothetical protein
VQPGAVRSSQEQPGASRRARSSKEQPEAARSSQEKPRAARSRQEQPGAARSKQEQPRAAKSSQEQRKSDDLVWERGKCMIKVNTAHTRERRPTRGAVKETILHGTVNMFDKSAHRARAGAPPYTQGIKLNDLVLEWQTL